MIKLVILGLKMHSEAESPLHMMGEVDLSIPQVQKEKASTFIESVLIYLIFRVKKFP